MKKKLKLISKMLIMTVMVASLAGCGSKAESTKKSNIQNNVSDSAATASQAPAQSSITPDNSSDITANNNSDVTTSNESTQVDNVANAQYQTSQTSNETVNTSGGVDVASNSSNSQGDYVDLVSVGNNKYQLIPKNKIKDMYFDNGISAKEFRDIIEIILDDSDWHDGYSINDNMYWELVECLALSDNTDNEIAECMVIAACFAYESDDWMHQYPDTNTFDNAVINLNDMTYHIYYGANDLEFNANTRHAKLNDSDITWIDTYMDVFIRSAIEKLGLGAVQSQPSIKQSTNDGEYYIKQISGPHITGYEKYIADKIESTCGSRIVRVDTERRQPMAGGNYFYYVYLEDGSEVQLLEVVDPNPHLEVYKMGSSSNIEIIAVDDKIVNS